MWTVLKIKKNLISNLEHDLKKKFGNDLQLYIPKFEIKKDKKIKKIHLLNDYIFCYHSKFSDLNNIRILNFLKGIKYSLTNYNSSQNEIINFIETCKKTESKEGILSNNFFEKVLNRKYQFISGPFSNLVFEIIKIQRKKFKVLIGNFKTTVENDSSLYRPI
tara:strand:+ start:116 stop:601 length:486 start_codon:yes stop_codon:yes gene_type:complete